MPCLHQRYGRCCRDREGPGGSFKDWIIQYTVGRRVIERISYSSGMYIGLTMAFLQMLDSLNTILIFSHGAYSPNQI